MVICIDIDYFIIKRQVYIPDQVMYAHGLFEKYRSSFNFKSVITTIQKAGVLLQHIHFIIYVSFKNFTLLKNLLHGNISPITFRFELN